MRAQLTAIKDALAELGPSAAEHVAANALCTLALDDELGAVSVFARELRRAHHKGNGLAEPLAEADVLRLAQRCAVVLERDRAGGEAA